MATAIKPVATDNKPGRFQLEAAIQSIHSQRAIMQQTDWVTLIQLYETIIQLAPTIGVDFEK